MKTAVEFYRVFKHRQEAKKKGVFNLGKRPSVLKHEVMDAGRI